MELATMYFDVSVFWLVAKNEKTCGFPIKPIGQWWIFQMLIIEGERLIHGISATLRFNRLQELKRMNVTYYIIDKNLDGVNKAAWRVNHARMVGCSSTPAINHS